MNFLNLCELGEISAEYLHFAGPLSVAITDFVRAQRAAILFSICCARRLLFVHKETPGTRLMFTGL